MSDIKKDLEQIEAFLKQKSPLGAFARQEEPEYHVLKAEVENTGRILAKAEYVKNMREIQHHIASLKLQAFVSGEQLPKNKIEAIEADIANFITELKEGKWSC